MTLEEHLEEIRTAIKARRFGNEAAVSQGIVLRLLAALDWPAYDTQIVCPEYALEGRRVDFALCHRPGKPLAFVEVKQLGQSDGAERQLFEYAFHLGVQLVILTDGQDWSFFLPGEQGDYGERRVYNLDILEREIVECDFRLKRYLKYDAVISGAALEAAREDYKNISRDRQMQRTLPLAWSQLVSEEDDLLLELVADRVEGLCGYKPEPDVVASFLKENVTLGTSSTASVSVVLGERSRALKAVRSVGGQREGMSKQTRSVGFVLNGQAYPARNATDVLINILEELTRRDASFPNRFASLPKHGRKRRYIAQDPTALYPDSPHLVRDHSKQLTSGWWVSTNHSHATTGRIIEMACNVARLTYGRDLQVQLGD